MKRFYYNSVITLKRFLKHEKGAIFIEMAVVLPLMITVIMAIFEYSIIFAMRTGINNQLQAIMRIRSTSSVDYSAAPYNVTTLTGTSISNRNARATVALYRGLNNIVFDITQARISTKMANTLNAMPANSTNSRAFTATEPTTSMIQYSTARYAQIELNYKYNYITPVGVLIKFLTNQASNTSLDMIFMAIYRND